MFDEKTASPEEIAARLHELDQEVHQLITAKLGLIDELIPAKSEQELLALSRRAEALATATARLFSEQEHLMELLMALSGDDAPPQDGPDLAVGESPNPREQPAGFDPDEVD
ncbi:MAG TPA: hypothetical protein VGB85_18945 [Nannocystis sp.]|jgi:thioesterase domain-containing protein